MAGIDMEDESVLKIIFSAGSSEDSGTPTTAAATPDISPEVCRYVRELSSFGLERIRREPQLAREEADAVLEQTQDLVFNNYKTFIHAAECSKEIFKDFKLVERHLDEVNERLPDFVERCRQFQQTSRDIAASRRLNTLTLQRHAQLLEVLEMPQLMDTCVRNGYHDEALRLAAHVARLARGKAGTAPALLAVAREVRAGVRLLAARLLRQLRTEAVQLPACLRIIGHLRGTGAFGEDELRLKFLQARDVWFQGIVDAVPSADPYQHVTKVIEVSRVHLFDVTTQYRAIFAASTNDDLVADPTTTTALSSNTSAAILHGWIARRVALFLDVLERDLVRGVGTSLDSLLNQCMYFGLSFGRIGADFRALMVAPFERAALASFERSIDTAVSRFAASMQSYVMTTGTAAPRSNPRMATEDLQPPTSLLEFPPLAELLNGMLSAMDELRPLVPLSAVADVTGQLQVALLSATKSVGEYHRAEEAGLTESERKIFARFVERMAYDLLPHVDRCLRALFPRQQMALVLGISVAELNRMDAALGRLDVGAVLAPVAYLLPVTSNVNDFEESQISPEISSDGPVQSNPDSKANSAIQSEIVPPTEFSPDSQSDLESASKLLAVSDSVPLREDELIAKPPAQPEVESLSKDLLDQSISASNESPSDQGINLEPQIEHDSQIAASNGVSVGTDLSPGDVEPTTDNSKETETIEPDKPTENGSVDGVEFMPVLELEPKAQYKNDIIEPIIDGDTLKSETGDLLIGSLDNVKKED